MSKYCTSFLIYKYIEPTFTKNKVDYSNVIVESNCNGFYVVNSGKKLSGYKTKRLFGKTCYIKTEKKLNRVDFSVIFESTKNMEEYEKEILPKLKKYFSRKLFFKPNFKKAFEKRVDRILQNVC